MKHLQVISYFWLFARQRTHQAFVFYDNCQLVIPSLIWRLRALECFSSNLESDLSFHCCDKGPQNTGDECQAAKGKIEEEDYEPCGVENPLEWENENKRLDFLRLWLSITQTEFLLEFVFVLMLSQVKAGWVSEELGGAVKQSLSF